MQDARDPSLEKPTLHVHEWLAIAVIIGLMGMLTAVSLISSRPSASVETGPPHVLVDPYIEVIIEGAVEKPGKYKVKKGTAVREIINDAILLPASDTRRINMNARARKGQVLHIPKKEMLTVYLEGLVDSPGALSVPKGTRLIDLVDRVGFAEEADLHPCTKNAASKTTKSSKSRRRVDASLNIAKSFPQRRKDAKVPQREQKQDFQDSQDGQDKTK